MAGVREICDRHGIVFIADEVMAGFGRTGKWFAIDHFDVVPDLMTFAKGVNSGYVPLGGVAISEAIAATFGDRAYPGGLTYSGHPLATRCRRRDHQRDGGRGHGEQRRPHRASRCSAPVCASWRTGTRPSARSAVSACSGRSSWSSNRKTREPLAPYGGSSPAMDDVLAACKSGGLLPFANFNRIHVVPPCNVSDAEVAEGLRILDAALTVGRRLRELSRRRRQHLTAAHPHLVDDVGRGTDLVDAAGHLTGVGDAGRHIAVEVERAHAFQ